MNAKSLKHWNSPPRERDMSWERCIMGEVKHYVISWKLKWCENGQKPTQPTLNLFVRQWWDWDKVELLLELLIEPVKVLVPPGHLDVIKLKKAKSDCGRTVSAYTYTRSELVGNVAFKPLKLGLFFGTCHDAWVRGVGIEPRIASITTFLNLVINHGIPRQVKHEHLGGHSHDTCWHTTMVSWSTSWIGKLTLPSI